jgi:probable phosphoglycerate mutase
MSTPLSPVRLAAGEGAEQDDPLGMKWFTIYQECYMTTFLLIRHGANDLVGKVLAGRTPGVHLNDLGRRQAEGLGLRLADAGIQGVFSSPRERCRETAEPLARRLGLKVQIAGELEEIDYGAWTGQTVGQVTASPEWQRFQGFRSFCQAPEGEAMLDVQARLVGLVRRLVQDFPAGTLALFCHADPIRAVLCFFLGMPLDLNHRLEISPASVSALEVGAVGARVLYVNHTEPIPL